VRTLPDDATVVVSSPPVFAPATVLAAARRRTVNVAIDVHSGALNDPRWRWSFAWMRRLLRRCDLVLVTNREIVRGVDLPAGRVVVVHDPLAFEAVPVVPAEGLPVVVFPASGADDEPIDAVIEAAELLRGSARIVVTGRHRRPLGAAQAVGFLPVDDYRGLLAGAAAVLALTTREATMQCAAYEALHLGLPIVCSDTVALRGALGPSAVVVSNTGESIAAGIREALDRGPELAASAAVVNDRLRQESRTGLAAVEGLSHTTHRTSA
jgi:glycosyltransferase involved in cell wall biosynthesis